MHVFYRVSLKLEVKKITLFPETHVIACANTHLSNFTCDVYCTCKIIVFSLFVLLLLYISCKTKYIIKQAASFFVFTFKATVFIARWYISHTVGMLFITLFSSSKGFFTEDYTQDI